MLQLTTELEAVNTMLMSIGESPVNTLDNPGVVDAVLAKSTLDEVNREVQSRGWHFNTERNYKLVPEAFSPFNIYVPNGTLYLDAVDPNIDVVTRGNPARLYDKRNHTYEWASPVFVDMVVLLEFENLPQTARSYITIRAARLFQTRVVGSETLHGFHEQSEFQALLALKRAESARADRNLLTGNYGVYRVLDRKASSGGMW